MFVAGFRLKNRRRLTEPQTICVQGFFCAERPRFCQFIAYLKSGETETRGIPGLDLELSRKIFFCFDIPLPGHKPPVVLCSPFGFLQLSEQYYGPFLDKLFYSCD